MGPIAHEPLQLPGGPVMDRGQQTQENSAERRPPDLSEPTPWSLVLLLVGAGVVAAFQVGKAPPMLLSMRSEFGMSLFLAGWILSIFNVVGFLLGSIAGAVADVFGHRRLLLIGFILQAFGSLAGSFAAGTSFLLTTRALEGLGFLFTVVAAPAMVARVTNPKDIRVSLAMWSCFLPAGVSLIMLLVPLVILRLDWRELWQVNAVILVAYAFWLKRGTARLAGLAAGPKKRMGRVWRDLRLTVTSSGPVLLAAIFMTYALQWLCVMGFLPTLLAEEYGLSAGRASVFTAIMVAMKDKMDLSFNIATGSSAQIALFVAPLLVLVGFAIGNPMNLAGALTRVGGVVGRIEVANPDVTIVVAPAESLTLPASERGFAPAHARPRV